MQNSRFIPLMLASGGDHRIAVPHGANTNAYGASPYPRSTLGYASSTANDISLDAFRHLEGLIARQPAGELTDPAAYRCALDGFRHRIRDVWQLDPATDIVFAPSGTDLEFVALAIAGGLGDAGPHFAHGTARPVTNVLLGHDEVGSGCALAAAGRYFAGQTAVSTEIAKGSPVDGLNQTSIVNIPVRDAVGQPVSCATITQQIDALARAAARQGRQVLAHVVHGSKTGLVLPSLAGIDTLRARLGDRVRFVVDACQARIEGHAIRAYLERDAIVMLTGSKFMGGPPFSGFALVPPRLRPRHRLAGGLANIFRRGEWPLDWSCCDDLPVGANPGLRLRLEAALFELERFGLIEPARRDRVIALFGSAVRGLAARLGVGLVGPALASDALHHGTLATLDLSVLPGRPDFAMAQRWYRVLAARGMRLGQPVKCVLGTDGGWAGTLRISLSMPLIVHLSQLDEVTLSRRLHRDMLQIAEVLEAAQRPVVA